MSDVDVIRAWKDPLYRNQLGREELKDLPTNPAGLVELSDQDLVRVVGGADDSEVPQTTAPCLATAASVIATVATAASGCPSVCGTCRIYTRGCC